MKTATSIEFKGRHFGKREVYGHKVCEMHSISSVLSHWYSESTSRRAKASALSFTALTG